jgi:hypothetical protein
MYCAVLQPVQIPKIELLSVAHQAPISSAPPQTSSGAPLGTAVAHCYEALLKPLSGAPGTPLWFNNGALLRNNSGAPP